MPYSSLQTVQRVKNPNYDPNNPRSQRYITKAQASTEAQNRASGLNELFKPFGSLFTPFTPQDFKIQPSTITPTRVPYAAGVTPTAVLQQNTPAGPAQPSATAPTSVVRTPAATPASPAKAAIPTAVTLGGAEQAPSGQTNEQLLAQIQATNPQLAEQLRATLGANTSTPTAPTRLNSTELASLAEQAGKAGLDLSSFLELAQANGAVTTQRAEEIRTQLGIPNVVTERFSKPAQTTRELYNSLYDLSGLRETKAKIAAIDDEIKRKRADLVTATGELNNNPWISQATRAGRLKNLQELAYADINNSIEQRNQLMDLYDTGVGQIETEVGLASADFKEAQQINEDQLNYLLTEAERLQTGEQQDALTQGLRNVPDFLRGVDAAKASDLQDELRLIGARKTTSGGGGSAGTLVGNGFSQEEAIQRTDNYMRTILSESAGGKTVDVSTRGELRKSVTVVNQLSDLEQTISGANTGPILGILRSNNPYDVQAGLIQAQLTSIIPNLARGVYGEVGVLTDRDVALYRQTLPNLSSPKQLRDLLMSMTVQTVKRGLEDQLEIAAQTGLDVSGLIPIYDRLQQTVERLNGGLGIATEDTRGAGVGASAGGVSGDDISSYLNTL